MSGILSEAGVAEANQAAVALSTEYGSIAAALAASPARLRRLVGEDAIDALAIFRARMLYVLRDGLEDRPVLPNWQTLLDYLRGAMAFEKNEHVRLLHLNTRNILILDEILSHGTINQATVHVREVIVRSLEVGSASIILVHNHPSGDPSPSRADIEITRAIIDAGKRLDITVQDHLIIGSSGHVSLRARGLI